MPIEIKRMISHYKGMDIEWNLYGNHEYSVQYCGDDYFFETERDAEEFIDELICLIDKY